MPTHVRIGEWPIEAGNDPDLHKIGARTLATVWMERRGRQRDIFSPTASAGAIVRALRDAHPDVKVEVEVITDEAMPAVQPLPPSDTGQLIPDTPPVPVPPPEPEGVEWGRTPADEQHDEPPAPGRRGRRATSEESI